MENNTSNYVYDNVTQINDDDSSRKYLAKVFTWMFVALGVSAFVAFEFFANQSLMNLILVPGAGFTLLGYAAIFSPLVFSMVVSFGFNRISYVAMLVIFMAYAVAIGITLSIFGLIYTAGSIFTVFLSASVVFGIMAIAGYTTHQDLTQFGSILRIVLFGAFAVWIINMFMHSAKVDYLISFVFVAIMIGLTSYYVQMLKRIGAGIEYGTEESKKLVIIGAFVLYTTFINLFMWMLRIFGRRR